MLELRPTAVAAGGDAIARDAGGRVVFVTGALPGERVRVEVLNERRDYARSRVVEVLDRSSDRVAPPCPELGRGCGGCQWQHIAVEAQRDFKREIVTDALLRLGHVEAPPIEPTIALGADAYRTTIRAAVANGRAGYRHTRAHDVVAVESCMVTHPLVVDLLVHSRYPGASEVVLRCGARTGERLASPTPTDAPIGVPADVRSDHLHEVAAGRRWRISAPSFFQAHPEGADALAALVSSAADELGGPTVAADLYSGVGLFAGVLADRGWSVIAVDGSSAAVADARVNLRDDNVRVVGGDVTQWIPSIADFVVADPSRNGLGRAGVDVVVGTDARRIVLVSCDAAACARDAGLLCAAGYTLTAVKPVDLFPHTFHIEIVSIFDR